jgi:outer membrane protein OmpA-like peptidoglycan-associated protein
LTSLSTGLVAIESFSNKRTGDFLVCLPTDDEYALTVSKEGYLFYSENISLAGENSSTDPLIKDVPLEPIRIGAKMVLKNIFFETDKYDLKESSKIELNRLVELLNTNPGLKLEIGGHTDNIGTPEYNQTLSENRAKTVNQYLVDSGINQTKLIYKGYGETSPVDTNDTAEGRANNRRTEFKVVEI